MEVVKQIVCLANSRKLGGRCIAGKELINSQPGGWVRPVSAREHEEVSEEEQQYDDGNVPRILDLIEVSLIEPRPKDHHKENWLLDPGCGWIKLDRILWTDLQHLTDPCTSLWINGCSTHNGLHDRIPLDQALLQRSSLRLIHVDRLTLTVFAPSADFGKKKRRVQASFRYNRVQYILRVTDPIHEKAYLAMPNGDYAIGESFITVSLGEPYGAHCYKLIAAIIPYQE